jgi:hypothetical protein
MMPAPLSPTGFFVLLMALRLPHGNNREASWPFPRSRYFADTVSCSVGIYTNCYP